MRYIIFLLFAACKLEYTLDTPQSCSEKANTEMFMCSYLFDDKKEHLVKLCISETFKKFYNCNLEVEEVKITQKEYDEYNKIMNTHIRAKKYESY